MDQVAGKCARRGWRGQKGHRVFVEKWLERASDASPRARKGITRRIKAARSAFGWLREGRGDENEEEDGEGTWRSHPNQLWHRMLRETGETTPVRGSGWTITRREPLSTLCLKGGPLHFELQACTVQ